MAKCRVCGESLPERPLLRYPDMPPSAQGFTDEPAARAGCGIDLALFQCAACGMIQLDNPPVVGHRDVVRASAYSAQMREFRQNQFADWVHRHRLDGRSVVEIGCGRGEYLALLNETGARACGVEHAADAVRACRGLGLKAARAYPSRRRQALPGAPFDGFMTLNFVEHWPDPIGGLRTVARSLTDGAIGLVEVPNFDMVVGAGMFAELCADHLLYFTRDTLRFTLQRAGFEVLDCRPVWHD